MMSAHAKVYNYVIKSCVLHMTIKGLQNPSVILKLVAPSFLYLNVFGEEKKGNSKLNLPQHCS